MAVNRPLIKEYENLFDKYYKLALSKKKANRTKARRVLGLIMERIAERFVILKLPEHRGYSFLILEQLEPRIHLQYIPHPDGKEPPPAHIRGIIQEDVDKVILLNQLYVAK